MIVEVVVNVGGLWRTRINVAKDTTWAQVKQLICKETAVSHMHQILNPGGDDSELCELADGDEVMCEWGELYKGRHTLHSAGERLHDIDSYRTLHTQSTGAVLHIRQGADSRPKTVTFVC